MEEQNAELEGTVAQLQRENGRLRAQDVTHRGRLDQVRVLLEEARRRGDALETQNRASRRQMAEMGAEVEQLRKTLEEWGSKTEEPAEELLEAHPDPQVALSLH